MSTKQPELKASRFLNLRCNQDLYESVTAACKRLDMTPSQFTRQSLAHSLQLIQKRENMFA